MATPNGLNPDFTRIVFPNGAIITGGTAGSNAEIAAELDDPTDDSIYISSDASTPGIYVLVSGTWTKLTIN